MKRLRSDLVFLLACLVAPAVGLLGSAAALGDTFNWETLNGQNWLTPADNQGAGGYCWAFSMVGALEAKYKLTRNDPNFNIDLSEQNLICDCNQGGPATVPFTTGMVHRGRTALHVGRHLAPLSLAARLAAARGGEHGGGHRRAR